MLSTTVNAAQSATVKIVASNGTLHAGETITFSVKITGCEAAKSIGIIPTYDESIFELVSGEWLISGAALSDFSDGTATIAYVNVQTFNENVFKFKLKVKSGAGLGTKTVSATVNIKNGSETISCVVTGAKVTVECKHNYSDYVSVNESSHKHVCSKCNNVEVLSHSYTNGCDTKCNACGYVRTINHSYKTKWSSDSKSHWHECSICGEQKDLESHIPGDEATEVSDQICTMCGYVIQKAFGHQHIYLEEWNKDESGHWNSCVACGEMSSKVEHIYENNCDEICNVCEYRREITHSYDGVVKSDDNGHWYQCIICEKRENIVPHNYNNICDSDCNDCGYIRVVEHVFDKGVVTIVPTDNISGEKRYTCTVCGQKKIVELEYYRNDDAETNEKDSNYEKNILQDIGLEWMVFITIISIVIGGAGGFFVAKKFLLKNKK